MSSPLCCPSPPALGSFLGVLPDPVTSPSHVLLELLLLTSCLLTPDAVALFCSLDGSTRWWRAPGGQRPCLTWRHVTVPDLGLLHQRCSRHAHWMHGVNKWTNMWIAYCATTEPFRFFSHHNWWSIILESCISCSGYLWRSYFLL